MAKPALISRWWRALGLAVAITACQPAQRARTTLPAIDPLPPYDRAALTGEALALPSESPLPLGHATDAEGGAWLLRDGASVAVVSGRHGHLVAFGASGGVDGVDTVAWGAQQPLTLSDTTLETIEVLDGRALHVVERLRSHDATLHAWLDLRGRVLTIRTQLVAGRERVAATLGEVWGWSNTPTWISGHGVPTRGGAFGGRFVGRHSAGLAYAACRADGRRLDVRISWPGTPGYHRRATSGEERQELEPGTRSEVRTVQIAWSSLSIGDAASQLDSARDLTRSPVPVSVPSAHTLEVAGCETLRAHAARLERDAHTAATREAGALFLPFHARAETVLLPTGCARARFTAPGHAPGAWLDPLASWDHPDRAPTAGTLRWRVRDEAGATLPSKLEVSGRSGTPDPDWGEDTAGGAAKNYAYTRGGGERPLPPGRYRVRIQRGFEYTRHETDVEVDADRTVTVRADLERVVRTAGYLSADLHVHALPSSDAPTLLEDRVLSLAAVGVEVAVATDHNAVTDYAPAIAKLGLERHLGSIVGDEVTTDEPEVGHFNVFPLPLPHAPLRWRASTVSELFTAARASAPDGVLQVNHPRMGTIGYFDILHLDRHDVDAWRRTVPAAALTFDAIEVFNGDHYTNVAAVRNVMQDWFALLDAGSRYTATGNSDSHKIAYHDAGIPRNWVATASDEPAPLDERAFVRAVRQGRVIVSSGPFVTLHADTGGDRAGIGDTIESGDVALTVEVDAPPWMALGHVELLRRGEPIARWSLKDANDTHPRLAARHRTRVTSGDWVIAVVDGGPAMDGFYRSGARPFAFTNPIFVR
ncbi:MAG: CehA/McbA family metallohydrolase [Polyangiaceae bacterium]